MTSTNDLCFEVATAYNFAEENIVTVVGLLTFSEESIG